MTEQPLLTERVDNILVVTLNRPAKLNAINMTMLGLLDQAVATLRDDPTLRLMLIRSTGRYFCAGIDLLSTDVSDLTSGSAIRTDYRIGVGGLQRICDELEAVEKPVVVAHHATCVGGGLEISLSCDFRLAAKSARYSFPEANFGCIPASGGVSRLTRMVGAHWSRYIIMANKPVDAERALLMGMVHEVFPDDTFQDDVMAFCRHVAAQKPEVTSMAKLSIEMARDMQAAQGRNVERLAASALMLGREYQDGIEVIRKKLGK